MRPELVEGNRQGAGGGGGGGGGTQTKADRKD